jgi:GNAT superfamily N-acetyltransferase
MALRLRLATLDDLDLLVRHRRGMWEDIGMLGPGVPDPTQAAYRAWVRARLRSGRLVGFVVEEKGEPVASGCIWLQEIQPRPHLPGPRWPYLMSMFTEPEHRGKGAAARIVGSAIAWSRRNGYSRLVLHASEAGRPVYKKFGFQPGIEMWLELPAP